jgi:hypothetical protein
MHDSQRLLALYTPTLFECSSKDLKTASRIKQKYRERWRFMRDSIDRTGVFSAQTCVFDLLWRASDGNAPAIAFLKWIDVTAKEALQATTGTARVQVRNLIIKIIVSFGGSQSQYKNHLTELATATKLIRERSVELAAVEKLLPNGNRIDFELVSKQKSALVEVYNIDFAIEKLSNSNDLKTFLEKRILDKIKDKFAGLDPDQFDWIVVPVLWGNVKELRKYREAFDYFKQVSILSPFMMIAEYLSAKNEYVYDFGTVEFFLQKEDEIRRSKSG